MCACDAATPDADPALPALVDLFKSTGGQQWANSSNWLSPMDVCTWCDAPTFFPPFVPLPSAQPTKMCPCQGLARAACKRCTQPTHTAPHCVNYCIVHADGCRYGVECEGGAVM